MHKFGQLFLVLLAISLNAGHAAQGTKPKTQPVQKGAVQMPGDNGKVGVPYQLGPKGDELVFTLEKAEFASRFMLSNDVGFPDADKRFLILTVAVQNPASSDRSFSTQSFSYTVVSPDDQNYLCDGLADNGYTSIHPDRRERMNIQLKPAQKVRALIAVEMHPKGPVNKLIVQRVKGTPVLRYDLKGKVAPMKGAFAANDGMDMLATGASMLNTVADLGPWDITVEKVNDEPAAIGEYTLDTGNKWIVFTVVIKNASMAPYPLHKDLILSKVTDVDGGALPESRIWLKNSTPDGFVQTTVEPGGQVRVRVIYQASIATKAEKITFSDQQYSGRSVAVKLEEPKKS
jgi:hypothetical protein